jgi:hypothetical protein
MADWAIVVHPREVRALLEVGLTSEQMDVAPKSISERIRMAGR